MLINLKLSYFFSGNQEVDEIGLYNEIQTMGMYFGPLGSGKKLSKFSQPKILEDWEDLNVEIPSKRKRMREYFVEVIKEQNKGVLEKNHLY